MSTPGKLRVALISHGHPELSPGGGERASYTLFQLLQQRAEFAPVYVARAMPSELGHSSEFGAFRGRPDEILWASPGHDRFRLVSRRALPLQRQTHELLANLAPDIVHVHHFVGFGTDLFRFLADAGLPIVLTLHEYLSICNHWGMMLKTDGRLCFASSHTECSACFPEHSSGKFFLRKNLLLDHLSHVSAFIAPSEFLAQRYVDWGLPADRIHVIENPLPGRRGAPGAPPAPGSLLPKPDSETVRLAYFGQYTPFKGIDVLLDAVALLDEDVRKHMRLSLFGFEINPNGNETEKRIAAKLAALTDCVVSHGRYRNEEVVDLMQSFGWIVVPSIWWENSPVVIQEARAAGVPVLCSNVGGMLEKVRAGVDGAHFHVGDPIDLADKIAAIVNGDLTVKPEPAPDHAPLVDRIVEIYRSVISTRASPASRRSLSHG